MEALQETLRPILKPITANLPGPIDELAVSLLGPRCHASLVRELTITDQECLKLAVSKALGLGIVGASSIVKVPQILKLLNSKSASGVSVVSYLLETIAYVVTLAYNFRNAFPFSTYGETALIAAQNVVITALVFNYSGRAPLAAVFIAVLAAAVGTLVSDQIVDLNQLTLLQAGAGALGVASKIPQIYTIWQQGGTGQLSAFTVRPLPLFLPPRLPCRTAADTPRARSSTTSSALLPASSPPSRRSTTTSSSTASSPASPSTPSSLPRWPTTGTPPPRRSRASAPLPPPRRRPAAASRTPRPSRPRPPARRRRRRVPRPAGAARRSPSHLQA